MEYAINYVFDADTGEMYDASVVFKDVTEGFAFRKRYHESGQVLRCNTCKNRATIGTHKTTLYFKHYPLTGDCILKDVGYSIPERQQIERYYYSKESPRHKHLKKVIGEYLEKTPGVDAESLVIDAKFLFDEREKRRPDVLCTFEEKSIAFEIQLSPLPPKYLFKRHEFYKRNGIFLMWILDNFDVKGKTQTERDIKYLNRHQNFFYFNDHSKPGSLVVQYKQGLINIQSKPYYEWTHQFVGLHQLKYDDEEFQPYYISFHDEQEKSEREAFKGRHEDVFNRLRAFYKSDDERHIPGLTRAHNHFEFEDYRMFEKVIGLGSTNELMFRAIKEGKGHFIRYILETPQFSPDPNKGPDGESLLQQILLSPTLPTRWVIIYLLFHHRYKITESDIQFLKTFKFHQNMESERIKLLIKIFVFNRLKIKHWMDLYREIEGPLLTILSARLNRIIGLQFNNYIGLANNAIHYYKPTFTIIEQAFKHYGLWSIIQAEDVKKTFEAKHSAFVANTSYKNDKEALQLLHLLFPEINGTASQQEWIKEEWLGLS